MLLDRQVVASRDVLDRLIRRNQDYKLQLLHTLNIGKKKTLEKLDREFDPLHSLNSIDFNQKWGNKMSNFDVELSFTVLDWKIAETVVYDRNFKIDNVEHE